MAQSVKSLMRSGLISPKASQKLAVLRQTRAQKSKMAEFNSPTRDESDVHAAQNTGHGHYGANQIKRGQHGKGPVGRGQEMPTRNKGRSTGFAASKGAIRGTRGETGGAEHHGGTYFPGKNQIDEFPQKQRRMRERVSTFKASPKGVGAFPSGTDVKGSGGFGDLNRGSRGGGPRYEQKGDWYSARNSRP
jgi:hypothetical protein